MKELYAGQAIQVWTEDEDDGYINVNFISSRVTMKLTKKEWRMIQKDLRTMGLLIAKKLRDELNVEMSNESKMNLVMGS